MLNCPGCSTTLAVDNFYRNAGRKTNTSVLCKECFKSYEATPHRRAKRTWQNIVSRLKRQHSYRHVELRMTRTDFIEWAVPQFYKWIADGHSTTPSIDRIDPKGHYELGNIRLTTRAENSRLASNHPNVFAKTGQAWCHVCKAYLPSEHFWKSASSYNGLQNRCKKCQTDAISASNARKSRG